MADKKGKCTSFGNCTKADSEEDIIQSDSDFLCPECGSKLTEVRPNRRPAVVRMVVLGGAVLVVAAMSLMILPAGPGEEPPGDLLDSPFTPPVDSLPSPGPDVPDERGDLVGAYFDSVNVYLNQLADFSLSGDVKEALRQDALTLFETDDVWVVVQSDAGNFLERVSIADYLAKQIIIQRDLARVQDISINARGRITAITITETKDAQRGL